MENEFIIYKMLQAIGKWVIKHLRLMVGIQDILICSYSEMHWQNRYNINNFISEFISYYFCIVPTDLLVILKQLPQNFNKCNIPWRTPLNNTNPGNKTFCDLYVLMIPHPKYTFLCNNFLIHIFLISQTTYNIALGKHCSFRYISFITCNSWDFSQFLFLVSIHNCINLSNSNVLCILFSYK